VLGRTVAIQQVLPRRFTRTGADVGSRRGLPTLRIDAAKFAKAVTMG
jgi:hypothetical protein